MEEVKQKKTLEIIESFFLKSDKEQIKSLLISPDNKFLFYATDHGKIKQFDLKSYQEVNTFKNYHTNGGINRVMAISSDSCFLYCISDKDLINKWDIVSGKNICSYEAKLEQTDIILSKDNQFLFYVADRSIFKIDLESKQETIIFRNDKFISSIILSQSEKYIFFSSEHLIKKIDIQTGHEISCYDNITEIKKLYATYDDKYLISCDVKHNILKTCIESKTSTSFEKDDFLEIDSIVLSSYNDMFVFSFGSLFRYEIETGKSSCLHKEIKYDYYSMMPNFDGDYHKEIFHIILSSNENYLYSFEDNRIIKYRLNHWSYVLFLLKKKIEQGKKIKIDDNKYVYKSFKNFDFNLIRLIFFYITGRIRKRKRLNDIYNQDENDMLTIKKSKLS